MFISNRSLSAAEIINIKFEEMIIPISIDKLSKLETYKDDSTELTDWINSNGLKKIFELSKILEYPVFKERGFSTQILTSWIGRKVISELGKTIIVPGDEEGIIVLNTIKDLLLINKEVSTLDLLKAIPIEEIDLDIDNLILIVSSWKRDLYEQQNLVDKLNQIEESEENSEDPEEEVDEMSEESDGEEDKEEEGDELEEEDVEDEEEEIEEVIHSDIEEFGEKEDVEQEAGEREEGEGLEQEGGEVESHEDHKEESMHEKEWDKRLHEAMRSLEESGKTMNDLSENSSNEKDESKSPDESAASSPRNKSDI